MSIQASKHANPHKYRIFVAGIPSGIPKRTLENYFSQFGSIFSITELTKRVPGKKKKIEQTSSATEPSDIRGGVCLVTTYDLITRDTILNHPRHELKKRTIMCSKYKSVQTVIEENIEKNTKRVLLKRVSSAMKEDYVKKLVEQKFGPVEVMFAFLAEHKEGKAKEKEFRPFKTYSVMFYNTESAELAISTAVVKHSTFKPFFIEPFVFNYSKKPKKRVGENIAIPNPIKPTKYVESMDSTLVMANTGIATFSSAHFDSENMALEPRKQQKQYSSLELGLEDAFGSRNKDSKMICSEDHLKEDVYDRNDVSRKSSTAIAIPVKKSFIRSQSMTSLNDNDSADRFSIGRYMISLLALGAKKYKPMYFM